MTHEIPEHIFEIVGIVEAAWPNWKPSDETCAAWALILEPGDPKALRAATVALAREPRPFPPSAGEILHASMPQGPGPLACWGMVVQLAECCYPLDRLPKRLQAIRDSLPEAAVQAVDCLGGLGVIRADDAATRARFVEAFHEHRAYTPALPPHHQERLT